MKIAIVFGTRPEIIRLSRVISSLDRLCEVVLVHTGQNYAPSLSDIFFEEMGIRHPDEYLDIHSSVFAEQAGELLTKCGELLERIRPDKVLVLGDTNSGLSAIVAARMGIPVYHMEAGNRCYDNRVPEEINRRVIDHSSTVLMPYTERSKDNLVREGMDRRRIFVTGNPIFEVLEHYRDRISASPILDRLRLQQGEYGLATLHRAENVDDPCRLEQLMRGLDLVADTYDEPLIVSLHPRTASRLAKYGLQTKSCRVRHVEPLGLFDFVHLERHAHIVLSDSGTVQEECCILRVPSVTLRDATERPETIECGSAILAPAEPERMLAAVKAALATGGHWMPPPEYVRQDVAATATKVMLSHTRTPD